MILTAILAIDEAGGIGKNGQMPWPRLPRDMARFKKATLDRPCIVGHTTFRTLPPLPGRKLVVLSRAPVSLPSPDFWQARSINEAIAICEYSLGANETCVIGGAEVYRQMLPRCHQLLLTEVAGKYDADTRLDSPTNGFECEGRGTHEPDEKNPVAMTFSTWKRR